MTATYRILAAMDAHLYSSLPPSQPMQLALDLAAQAMRITSPNPRVGCVIVDAQGKELPWDGKTYGNLLVKGPWVVAGYFRGEGGDVLEDGWFPTGDVAIIDEEGYMQITDRSKDVIKSGGEWIGSIDLENIAVSHPAVMQAACVGIPHPKWDERPLLVVVKKPDMEVSKEELLKFYEGKIAKWWTPDDVVFADALPIGATGKILKNRIRDTYRDYKLPTA
jgi:fatty-acyl-CoA synthase